MALSSPIAAQPTSSSTPLPDKPSSGSALSCPTTRLSSRHLCLCSPDRFARGYDPVSRPAHERGPDLNHRTWARKRRTPRSTSRRSTLVPGCLRWRVGKNSVLAIRSISVVASRSTIRSARPSSTSSARRFGLRSRSYPSACASSPSLVATLQVPRRSASLR